MGEDERVRKLVEEPLTGAWRRAERLITEGSLDVAWAEAEAALPKGWGGLSVGSRYQSTDKSEERYQATAENRDAMDDKYGESPVLMELGSTPAHALRALAAVLRAQ